MHRSRRLVVLGVVLGAISPGLPFAELPPEGSVGGVEGQAWPVFVFLGPLLLLAITGDRREPFPIWGAVIGALMASGAVAFSIVKLIDAWMASRDVTGSVGVGAWLLVGATVITAVGAGIGFSRRI